MAFFLGTFKKAGRENPDGGAPEQERENRHHEKRDNGNRNEEGQKKQKGWSALNDLDATEGSTRGDGFLFPTLAQGLALTPDHFDRIRIYFSWGFKFIHDDFSKRAFGECGPKLPALGFIILQVALLGIV